MIEYSDIIKYIKLFYLFVNDLSRSNSIMDLDNIYCEIQKYENFFG